MSTELFPQHPESEIVCIRIVDATREKAFSAWSNPEHLKIWWGPAGFTNTFNEFDFQVGGKWDFIMHAPVKGNFVNSCEFTHIVYPELIAWKRYSQPWFLVVVTFESISPEKTKIVFRQIFDSPEACNKIKPHVTDKNEEVFDRLENELLKIH